MVHGVQVKCVDVHCPVEFNAKILFKAPLHELNPSSPGGCAPASHYMTSSAHVEVTDVDLETSLSTLQYFRSTSIVRPF